MMIPKFRDGRTTMILNRFPPCRLTPLGQMRACANLMQLLRDVARDEAVLRRHRVRISSDLCLDVLTELELVADQLDPDLRRELMAAHDRFADTATTVAGGRVPNPQIGANLHLAIGLVGQLLEALSMTLLARYPDQTPMGDRIIADLRG